MGSDLHALHLMTSSVMMHKPCYTSSFHMCGCQVSQAPSCMTQVIRQNNQMLHGLPCAHLSLLADSHQLQVTSAPEISHQQGGNGSAQGVTVHDGASVKTPRLKLVHAHSTGKQAPSAAYGKLALSKNSRMFRKPVDWLACSFSTFIIWMC